MITVVVYYICASQHMLDTHLVQCIIICEELGQVSDLLERKMEQLGLWVLALALGYAGGEYTTPSCRL